MRTIWYGTTARSARPALFHPNFVWKYVRAALYKDTQRNIYKISAEVEEGNTPMMKALEKVGFKAGRFVCVSPCKKWQKDQHTPLWHC